MQNNKGLRKLIIPLILEQLLAVSVGMVDTLMVSRVGEVAVSGVALVDNINRLVIQIVAAFAAGGAVICSQYYGSGKMTNAKRSCAQLESLMLISSLIISVICVLFSRGMLGLIFGEVEPKVMDAANTYLIVTALSYPFFSLYNAGAAIFRCFGNSRDSMIISIIMNAVNVALNAVFVFGCGLGVFGVALATLISRIVGGVIMKMTMQSEKNVLKVTDNTDYIPKRKYVGKILRIGIPSGIENAMFQIGKLLVVSMVATLGTSAIAANSIAYQIIDFPNIPGVAVGLALVVIVGQNIGADDKEGAVSDTKKLISIAYAGDWICKLFLLAGAPIIVKAFSLTPAAYSDCVLVLRCFAVASLPVWPLSFTLPNALRGAGDVKYTMFISIASMWICRIAVSYVLIHIMQLGILGVWIGMFADWYVRGFCYSARFLSKRWLNMKAI